MNAIGRENLRGVILFVQDLYFIHLFMHFFFYHICSKMCVQQLPWLIFLFLFFFFITRTNKLTAITSCVNIYNHTPKYIFSSLKYR